MSSRLRVGHVKTFSSGLGSGSVEFKYGGSFVSLPFTSKVIEGDNTQLHSGDRVHVSVSSDKNKKLRVVAIEAAPDQPEPENSDASDRSDASVPASEALTTIRVSVPEEGNTEARFTVENFVRSGSRLEFYR